MKPIAFLVLVSPLAWAIAKTKIGTEPAYVSTVEFTIFETDPVLMDRSRKLVLGQLNDTFGAWPEIHGKEEEIESQGNQIILSFLSREDSRLRIQHDVAFIAENLGGLVEMHGLARVFRTRPDAESGGYLEVNVDDSRTKIRSIRAHAVPFRDLLKEIKLQLKKSVRHQMNYVLPEECASRRVDYVLKVQEPRNVEIAVNEMASAFGLSHTKRNGMHVFRGDCMHPRATTPSHENLDEMESISLYHLPALGVPMPGVGIRGASGIPDNMIVRVSDYSGN